MFRVAFLIAVLSSAAFAQESSDPADTHVRAYKKIAPSVVFVRGGMHKGTGAVIAAEGYILTSIEAVGGAADEVTVQTADGKKLTGKVVDRVDELDLAIVKVAEKLPALELGESGKAKIGALTYVFGDSFSSMEVDGQVAISLGVLSGEYEVKARSGGPSYGGPVLETSCAVNPNQGGAPLTDARGRILGVITLNYDDSKFSGIAIPIDRLKPEIERILKDDRAGVKAKPRPKPKEKEDSSAPAEAQRGWMGIELADGGEAQVLKVSKLDANGPAEKAGLMVGDLIRQANGKKVDTLKGFREIVGDLKEGDRVTLRVERDGKEIDVTVTLGKKNEY